MAVGLGLGLSGQELLTFYLQRGASIFPFTGFGRRLSRTMRHLLAPKYSEHVLRRELVAAYGDKKLGDSRVRLTIPAYDTLRGRIYIFKTFHAGHLRHDIDLPAVDVALATAAAPTYFRAAKVDGHAEQGYVDGGLWANCPALTGVVEAVHFLGKRLDELDVLSIGTTFAPQSAREFAGAGLIGWGPKLFNLLMDAQVQASYTQARLLVGQQRFLRVDCLTQPGEYSLDRADEVQALAGLGRSKAVERDIMEQVQQRFLNGVHASPFVPGAVDLSREELDGIAQLLSGGRGSLAPTDAG